MSRLDAKRFLKFAPLIALFIYLGLTLLTINRFSIWHDESYSATLIDNSYGNIIHRTSWDVHPPFYYLALKTWSLLFGNSVVNLRLMSTACMLGAIVVAWRLFRKVFGQRAGLIALFGMAVGPFLIRYGQEMRMYGLGALLAASSTLLLWNLMFDKLNRRSRTWSLIGYTLLMTAAIYTHYFLSFLLAAHLLFVLKRSLFDKAPKGSNLITRLRQLPKALIAAIIAPLVLFIPWVPTVLAQFQKVHNAFWIGPFKVETLTSTVINFFSFMQQWELQHWTAVFGVLVLSICLFILGRWYKNLPAGPARDAGQMIGFIFFVPLILLVLVSLPPLQPAYQDRYLAFYAPFIYGAFGLGVARLLKPVSVTNYLLLGGAVISLGVGVISASLTGNNQGWRPLPRFTMKPLAAEMMAKAPEAPIVSTWLWTFLDAHTTLRDHPVYFYVPNGSYQYGDYSAVYQRNDVNLSSLDGLRGRVWILNESKKEAPAMPANWRALDRIDSGYAVAILYDAP